ncbi:MAG: ABC transporter ATP-binding protein [Gemmatimonadota bacterium]
MTAGWLAESLGFRYAGAPAAAVTAVGLDAPAGQLVAIAGPNGSGKTTLLRLLLGGLRPSVGRALYGGRPVSEWGGAALARRVGALAQHEEPAFPTTAGELIAMGRYPHLGAWRSFGPRDRAAIASAASRCRVIDCLEREFATLSGGERQRVRLARALAQEPDALALDEPTAALDLAHEMEIWELLAGAARSGSAVLLTTHNLNLAARYADRLVLLAGGRVIAQGSPASVLTETSVLRAYGWPVRIAPHAGPGPDRGAPQIVPMRPFDEEIS